MPDRDPKDAKIKIRPKKNASPFECVLKDCTNIGQWKPILLIPIGTRFGRVLLDVRICNTCLARAKPVLLDMAKNAKAERIKKSFELAGVLPPETLDNVDATFVRVTSVEARKADKAKRRNA